MWNPKPIKGKDEDFLQPQRSITLAEFLPRSFLEDHPEEILEVAACHVASIVEVNNNYGSYEEVDNSNEIKQRISVFNPFKRLGISTLKKARPSTSAFDRLKMTNDQQQREMKSLKAKSFHEENDDDKIHSRVPLRMKRKLSVDINTKGNSTPLRYVADKDLPMSCAQEDLHLHLLKYVAAKKVIVSYMLQPRMSSSQICCRREGCPLKYVAAEKIVVLKYVAAEIVIVSNMLQPRRSSSQICCSQKDLRLKYIVATNVVVSDMLQPRKSSSHICCSRGCRRLTYVVAEKVVPSNMLQLRRSSFLNMLQ
ncbi:hypothetical protein E5676_scaffold186G00740 [Cucumis melo var. makuwa]|uniref:Retrotransposon gag protein n=1 Tax=Cucumis melo var. makuwa TaxID=1194695 RepID=A0A5A7SQ83_CUCMM|nr:hypothetical protein E6C27_scaffold452G00990 [Cucumis melo var. makuwa]TYK14421.1 hypothetical protein E5676_scaffold186G00740 [Cucumis melo var. makuwa]